MTCTSWWAARASRCALPGFQAAPVRTLTRLAPPKPPGGAMARAQDAAQGWVAVLAAGSPGQEQACSGAATLLCDWGPGQAAHHLRARR